MAGLSSRFAKAGYTVPKYMLPLHGRTVFAHSLQSFAAVFATTPFLFIARGGGEIRTFIEHECAVLGIRSLAVAMLAHETKGQADTVAQGLDQADVADDTPITIFNIDTIRRAFRFPVQNWFSHADGYLEVFHGTGENWSYVGPRSDTAAPLVARTTEKEPISDLCCNGLYYFARAGDFRAALHQARQLSYLPELYVAPLYNHLISNGRLIYYQTISADMITFCGVPAEYETAKTLVSLKKAFA